MGRNDFIDKLPNYVHGTDPHGSDFDGACQFNTAGVAKHDAIMRGTGGYFSRGSKSYQNILNIIIGQSGDVSANDFDPDCP